MVFLMTSLFEVRVSSFLRVKSERTRNFQLFKFIVTQFCYQSKGEASREWINGTKVFFYVFQVKTNIFRMAN